MIATVDDGRLVSLRPDREHPLSSGFACQKGIAFAEVHNDPDRVTTPLRRTRRTAASSRSAGTRRCPTSPAGWPTSTAGTESGGDRLVLRQPGRVQLLAHPVAADVHGGTRPRAHLFTAGSQDVNNRFVASQLLYGYPLALPMPDVLRTDLLVVIGANPVVSHGSVLTVPRIRDRMHDIVKRGGRVLVVDPRKTETAAQFEWLPIVPDGDAYLLLSLLAGDVRREPRRPDAHRASGRRRRLAGGAGQAVHARGHASSTPASRRTSCDHSRAISSGRDAPPSTAGSGTSTGENGTLTTYLLDAVNLVAGNLDVAGGTMFGTFGLPFERRMMAVGAAVLRTIYHRRRSRIGDFPSVLMSEPAGVMAKEITTGGPGQIKALFVSAGNPVLSVPNGRELEHALGSAGADGRHRPLRQRDHRALRLRPARRDHVRARRLPAAVPDAAAHPVPAGHRGRRRTGRARRAPSGRSSTSWPDGSGAAPRCSRPWPPRERC